MVAPASVPASAILLRSPNEHHSPMMRLIALAGLLAALLHQGFEQALFAEEESPSPAQLANDEFFESKIRPVLVKHCYECHSAEGKGIQGGLRLDTQAAVQQGGDSGPAVVAHNVEASLLISALRYEDFEMPPQGKLPDTVIADFVTWVERGAPDPRTGGPLVQSGIDFETARQHWAYQPITQPQPPAVQDAQWCATEVDYFTRAKMEQLGLQPVPLADKRQLIRRATFDLIGLPPSPEEVADFVADDSPQAFSRVIDRLLQSEHYGERWGRYWLDVARYAEDQAHTFSVTNNTNAFRYRDWVVAAFNSDLPYDQFVKLQIAGDLLGPQSPDSYDHLIALGFFGLGAQYYKNSDAAQAAADELDDRVDTLTRGFLGLTVSCARCHDHKFDPIPTQDYYSLAGIFHSSKLTNAPLCDPQDVQAYNAGQQRIKAAEASLAEFMADEKARAAETKVDQIAAYIETVWKYRTAPRTQPPAKLESFAAQAGLNAFLLKRWNKFLDPKQKGKVEELDAWFELVDAHAAPSTAPDTTSSDTTSANTSASSPAVAAQVSQFALQFQQRVQQGLDVRNGVATTNLVDADAAHKPGNPRFVSPLVTKVRPTAGIDVDITGATHLYLVVSDGGNGNSCDHSDWLMPRLIGQQGELNLAELKWESAEGFGGARVNTNYQGKPLSVGGKKYTAGIGVHAPSVLKFQLPEGYQRFQAIGGLDNSGSDQGGCGDQAAIQFSVYTEKPIADPIGAGRDLLTTVLGKDGPFAVSDDDLENFLSGEQKQQLERLSAELADAKEQMPEMYPIAHSYAEATPQDLHVYVRGNPANQKELAPRRFLKILAGDEPPVYSGNSGRLQLAEAIASPENPLTARVIVNRVWQHHFGRGLVGTPSNFGSQGEAPTHPELLDYLTADFIASGWSIKQLHRSIMLSSTYRLSTAYDVANANIDADNRFLWSMNRRRLDIEAWRDSLLDVAGKLDRTLGGPSTDLADPKNVRRTIYAKISRHELDNLLRLFDFPDANITSAKRSQTTVPQQQLFILNSPAMVALAEAFAARVHQESNDDDASRIRRAFLLAYSRPVTERELEIGLAFLSGEPDEQDKLSRWAQYAQALLGANEFTYLD